jgi:hypothetical protein
MGAMEVSVVGGRSMSLVEVRMEEMVARADRWSYAHLEG